MGFGNMNKMMREFQKMQAEMQKMQAELEERTVEATAGGGVVRVVITGGLQVRSITVDPEAVDPSDVELLQDLLVAAVNEGMRRAQEMVQTEMQRIGAGLNLPGMPRFPS